MKIKHYNHLKKRQEQPTWYNEKEDRFNESTPLLFPCESTTKYQETYLME